MSVVVESDYGFLVGDFFEDKFQQDGQIYSKYDMESLKMLVQSQKDTVRNSPESIESIKYYTHEYDTSVNSCLRKGILTPKTIKICNDINGAIEKSKILPPLLLYRGVHLWNKNIYEVGSTFVDKGYSSKSLSVDIASSFSDSCCILLMGYLKPSKHIYIESLSKYGIEEEVLTYPGERFEVMDKGSIVFKDGTVKNYYYCRYVDNVYTTIYDLTKIPVNYEVGDFLLKVLDLYTVNEDEDIITLYGKGYNGKDLIYKFSVNPIFEDKVVKGLVTEGIVNSLEARINTLDINKVTFKNINTLSKILRQIEVEKDLSYYMETTYKTVSYSYLVNGVIIGKKVYVEYDGKNKNSLLNIADILRRLVDNTLKSVTFYDKYNNATHVKLEEEVVVATFDPVSILTSFFNKMSIN
jgi:hypothetical protein